MSYQTPGKARQSGIPAPGGRSTGIPTPGTTRPRSLTASSSGGSGAAAATTTKQHDLGALSDAIRANDPAQHRSTKQETHSPTSSTASGPRKSAGGWLQTPTASTRPSSSASSTKSTSPAPTTPTARIAPRASMTGMNSMNTPTYKTPTYAPRASTASSRPASRLSEAGGRAPSRAERAFEVGDMVRIESIGMEGILRFLGDIDGKPGLWAGVELAAGFAGRGKNDGSVNGVSYFTCPPKCGVFVASNKLSAPTIGALRPASVASSRGGRVTPAQSTGRVTPSPAPRTPKFVTPAAPRQSLSNNSSGYTAGSRASKYAGMTAKQLSAARQEPRSTSPPAPAITATPKAVRPSFGGIKVPGMQVASPAPGQTPKARRTDMPPPASPALSSRSHQTNDDSLPDSAALAAANKALQDKIAALTASITSPSTAAPVFAVPAPPASARAPTPVRAQTPLRSQTPLADPRVPVLEAENARLSAALEAETARLKEETARFTALLATEKESTRALEGTVKTSERAMAERTTKIEALERAVGAAQADVDKARADGEAKARDLQGRLEHQEALVTSLRTALETTEGRAGQSDALVDAKQTEISLLEARIERSTREWEEERKDLNLQVDELRLAGQETIALYEERLSASEQQKYELEDLLEALNVKVKELESAQPAAPRSAEERTTAAEIDNETLREQAVHLQQKIAALEDQLEDAQANFEREELAMRTRVTKYKEADERVRREADSVREERDAARRDEAALRQRLVEVEEALRENGVALENARADVEGLRLEIANLEGTQQANGEAVPSRLDEARKAERARAQEEIQSLKQTLEATRANRQELQKLIDTVTLERDEAVRQLEMNRVGESDSSTIEELRRTLEERAAELERLRKTANRDRPLTPSSPLDGDFLKVDGATTPRGSKHDREEITGLKHIIQELTNDNVSCRSQVRMLEAENKMLVSETEELRDAIKQLEATVEESILREERALNGELQALEASGSPPPEVPTDTAELQHALHELRMQSETELESLKKKLAAQEQKSAHTIRDLNKELSELESLVESKIYREDEMEREIERLKAKLERGGSSANKSSSRPSVVASEPRAATPSAASTDAVCEICEQPGHDIFTCHLLKDDPDPKRNSTDSERERGTDPSSLWCEDCESHGHVASECPHSLDVF